VKGCGDILYLAVGAAMPRRGRMRPSAELMVMATVGRVGIPGFSIGNAAGEVLQTCRASALAIGPAGLVSPAERLAGETRWACRT
jgi:hypothetical protein